MFESYLTDFGSDGTPPPIVPYGIVVGSPGPLGVIYGGKKFFTDFQIFQIFFLKWLLLKSVSMDEPHIWRFYSTHMTPHIDKKNFETFEKFF